MNPYLIAGLAGIGLLAAGAAGPATAQLPGVPGGPGGSPHTHQARVKAEAIRTVTGVLGEWEQAWEADDIAALLEIYTEDALVRFPTGTDELAQGTGPVAGLLRDVLPLSGWVRLSLKDFESDGELAISVGQYVYRVSEQGRSREIVGNVVIVLRRIGRNWRIRTQYFDSPMD